MYYKINILKIFKMYYIYLLYFKQIMCYICFGKSLNVLYFWEIRVATLEWE